MTHFLIWIGAINVACLVIRIACWFWKSRNWKPTPWLYLQGRQPW